MLDLADKFDVEPNQIHNWVGRVLEQAKIAFQVGPRRPVNLDNVKDRKIGQLEGKLAHKNEVIAELMEEHVKLKKGLGNSERSMGSLRRQRRDRRVCELLDDTRRTASAATPCLARLGH